MFYMSSLKGMQAFSLHCQHSVCTPSMVDRTSCYTQQLYICTLMRTTFMHGNEYGDTAELAVCVCTYVLVHTYIHTHTHPFTSLLPDASQPLLICFGSSGRASSVSSCPVSMLDWWSVQERWESSCPRHFRQVRSCFWRPTRDFEPSWPELKDSIGFCRCCGGCRSVGELAASLGGQAGQAGLLLLAEIVCNHSVHGDHVSRRR